VQISTKADYAIRALIELAALGGGPVKGERLAGAQHIPPKFLEAILAQLRQAGILQSRRGAEGGYWLSRAPADISLADIIRAVDGPLASVRGQRPETLSYQGPARHLTEVWIALRASLRTVLEVVTLEQLVTSDLPPEVRALAADPAARTTRYPKRPAM
jgi:Rrf2 family protein